METKWIEVIPGEMRPGDLLVRGAGAFPVLEVPEVEGSRWVSVVTTRRTYRLNPRSSFEVYREEVGA